ncbi:MAG: MarR family transcriptional regulator [Albidovulum sp.]
MTDTPAYHLEDQIGFKLRRANQRHLEIFTVAMPGLTPRQFAVLAKLLETGPLSQNHLGRLVAMDAATAKGVIDRLARKGLIDSTPSKTDKRRLEISLSDTGINLVTGAIPIAERISAQTAQNLTPREIDRLKTLLDKL